jgi:hypothetical protein
MKRLAQLVVSVSIAEIPVNWIAQPGSKVSLVSDSIKMLKDFSRIRWLHRNFQTSFMQEKQINHLVCVQNGLRSGSQGA